jgi:hypothetical protein
MATATYVNVRKAMTILFIESDIEIHCATAIRKHTVYRTCKMNIKGEAANKLGNELYSDELPSHTTYGPTVRCFIMFILKRIKV